MDPFAQQLLRVFFVGLTIGMQRNVVPALAESGFAGYGGFALAGLITGYLASDFDPRWNLFIFGLMVIMLALRLALMFSKETIHWARAESAAHLAAGWRGRGHDAVGRLSCIRDGRFFGAHQPSERHWSGKP